MQVKLVVSLMTPEGCKAEFACAVGCHYYRLVRSDGSREFLVESRPISGRLQDLSQSLTSSPNCQLLNRSGLPRFLTRMPRSSLLMINSDDSMVNQLNSPLCNIVYQSGSKFGGYRYLGPDFRKILRLSYTFFLSSS